MALIRDYEERDAIFVFDSQLDQQLSTYESAHLDLLAKAEQRHFWFEHRRDKIGHIFVQYVDRKSKILEIGCGTGFIADKLKKMGFSIEASDIYSNGLHYAKRKGIEKLYQFDLFNPPFHEEFDVICLFDVLEHLNEESLALNCLKKMLRPGGLLILTVPAHQWLWNRDDLIGGHKRRYTKKTLRQAFHAANLEPIVLSYFFISILPFLLIRSWTRPDSGQPLSEQDKLKLELSGLTNGFFGFITKLDFYLEKIIPNICGGSLLGIARKNSLF